ncbi:MAG: hypothetical protein H7258_05465 [Ferruginibacter sp.]|nr:hypothetical protein [Ferruginibacter sp.]
MGFIKSLFGVGSSSYEKLRLHDNELGEFTGLNSSGNRIIWKGTAGFLGRKVSLFIHGEKEALDASQKKAVMEILRPENHIGMEVDSCLKAHYESAGKKYSSRKTHFTCISITSSELDITITMEEKESFHNFNIRFINRKAVGLTIDS